MSEMHFYKLIREHQLTEKQAMQLYYILMKWQREEKGDKK